MDGINPKLVIILTILVGLVVPIIGSVVIYLSLPQLRWAHEPLHSSMEAVGALTALILALTIILLMQYRREATYYVWITCTLVGMGILDGFHAVTHLGEGFVWLHSMAVLFGGFLLALVWLPANVIHPRLLNVLPRVVAIAVIIFGVLSLAFRSALPVMVSRGQFTLTANIISISGGVFFLIAAGFFLNHYWATRRLNDILFASLSLLFASANLVFPFSQIWSVDWWFWHVLRISAYFVALSFPYISFQRVQEELKKLNESLERQVEERTNELSESNAFLKQEITDRKQAEEKLQASEKKLRDITSVLGEGVYVLDKNGKLTFMNPEAERLLGWTETELLGKAMHEAIHYQKADGALFPAGECPVLEITSRGGVYRSDEDVFTRKDGTMFPVAYVTTPIIENEKVVASVTSFQDITERKKAEEERKRAKQLSDALNDVNMTISSTLDFEDIMQRAVVESAKAIGCETAAIDTYENHRWVTKYIYGFPEEVRGVVLTDEEAPHATLAARTKKEVVINDALNDIRVNRKTMERFNIKSVMVIPLIVRGGVAGTLFFNYHSTPVSFTDTEIDFATKLATSISLALENVRLYEAQRHIADTLQESLLVMPEKIEGIDYGYLYRSATEAAKVGGDFYDIFEIEHGRVGIIIGDVSGSGIEAATLTCAVKNTIKAHSMEDGTPAHIVAKTNDFVAKTTPQYIFITVFFAILNTSTGELIYCSAGHPPAIIKRSSGEVELLSEHSPITGAFQGIQYRSAKSKINKGDTLISYTDGTTEARCNGGFYGEKRLISFIGNLATMPAREIPQAILNNVTECTGGKLSDDVALLAVSLEGRDNS